MFNKKILITGAAGFIGYHLSTKLSENNSITLIDNFTRNRIDDDFKSLIAKKNMRFINADLTNKNFYKDLDTHYDSVIHLAAINGTRYFYEKPYEVLRVNILSLMNMIEWINKKNTGKFIFSSSSEAYAGTISAFSKAGNYLPTNELIPLCIDNIFNERYSYGGSKLIGELIVVNYFKKVNVLYSIIRYHNIYGPRMGFEHVIPEFAKRVHSGENPFIINGGDQTRAFCFIDDAVKATKDIMLSKSCNNDVFHVGNSNEETNITDLAKKIFKISNFSADIKINQALPGSVLRRCPDTNKIEKLINYKPLITLNEGLKKTLNWYYKFFDK